MSLESELAERSGSKCELCGSIKNLNPLTVEPQKNSDIHDHILVCDTCKDQINNSGNEDVNHWRCLNDSMWSEVPAVQVMSWRMLTRLKAEGWPQDLLDMLYLDDQTLEWAEATGEGEIAIEGIKHVDSNGVKLTHGDGVVLIKDLSVKGSSLVAKRGTAVRNISLDPDNAEYIEGKVNGQMIVIITKYVKKL